MFVAIPKCIELIYILHFSEFDSQRVVFYSPSSSSSSIGEILRSSELNAPMGYSLI